MVETRWLPPQRAPSHIPNTSDSSHHRHHGDYSSPATLRHQNTQNNPPSHFDHHRTNNVYSPKRYANHVIGFDYSVSPPKAIYGLPTQHPTLIPDPLRSPSTSPSGFTRNDPTDFPSRHACLTSHAHACARTLNKFPRNKNFVQATNENLCTHQAPLNTKQRKIQDTTSNPDRSTPNRQHDFNQNDSTNVPHTFGRAQNPSSCNGDERDAKLNTPMDNLENMLQNMLTMLTTLTEKTTDLQPHQSMPSPDADVLPSTDTPPTPPSFSCPDILLNKSAYALHPPFRTSTDYPSRRVFDRLHYPDHYMSSFPFDAQPFYLAFDPLNYPDHYMGPPSLAPITILKTLYFYVNPSDNTNLYPDHPG